MYMYVCYLGNGHCRGVNPQITEGRLQTTDGARFHWGDRQKIEGGPCKAETPQGEAEEDYQGDREQRC